MCINTKDQRNVITVYNYSIVKDGKSFVSHLWAATLTNYAKKKNMSRLLFAGFALIARSDYITYYFVFNGEKGE